jgi:hypothetical protein
MRRNKPLYTLVILIAWSESCKIMLFAKLKFIGPEEIERSKALHQIKGFQLAKGQGTQTFVNYTIRTFHEYCRILRFIILKTCGVRFKLSNF